MTASSSWSIIYLLLNISSSDRVGSSNSLIVGIVNKISVPICCRVLEASSAKI